MPVEIVHPLDADLLHPMYRSALQAYLTTDDHAHQVYESYRARSVDPALAWVARDRGRVVGTLRSIEGRLSVPGGPVEPRPDVVTDLLSLVSVAPTHRRQGLLTRMITGALTEAHERGAVLAALVAAEWPIYGRFGYAPAAFETSWAVDGRVAALRDAARVGSLEEIDVEEASELAPPLYVAEARRRGGLVTRDELWWDRDLYRLGPDREQVDVPGITRSRHVVHRDDDGTVDGYVRWRVLAEDPDGADGVLKVTEVLAATPVAYRELWRFLLGIDLVSRLEYPSRPVDDPLPLLFTDGRAASVLRQGDALWLRLLDVPAALTARGYAVTDALVLDVVDPAVGGWGTGRWRLDVSPAGATCTAAAGATPDVTLPQTSLASLYLGGVSAATLAFAGGLDEHTPGAVARLDTVFGTGLAPWRATSF